jgi:replication factor C large subunit
MSVLNETLRPKTFEEVFLIKEDRVKIQKWADAWKSLSPSKKGLLLAGEPGLGKTSIAYALSNTMDWDLIEINASEIRTENFIKGTVGMFTLYGDLLSQDLEKRKTKVALIDEADNIHERSSKGSSGETGGYKAILDILKTSKIPIILTMNDLSGFRYRKGMNAKSIASLCEVVEIKSVYSRKGGLEFNHIVETLTEKILNFGKNLNLRPQKVVIEEIIKKDLPDIRASINDAEAYLFSQSETETNSSLRDRETIIFDTLNSLFRGSDYLKNINLIDSSDSDTGQILLWIEQNLYPQAKNFQVASDGLEYLSVVDIYDNFARLKNYYRMLVYVKDLEALLFSVIKTKTGTFIPFRFPNYLTLMSKSKKNRGTMNKVAKSISSALHTSKDEAYEMRSVLRIMKSSSAEFSPELKKYINEKISTSNETSVDGKKYKQPEIITDEELESFLS